MKALFLSLSLFIFSLAMAQTDRSFIVPKGIFQKSKMYIFDKLDKDAVIRCYQPTNEVKAFHEEQLSTKYHGRYITISQDNIMRIAVADFNKVRVESGIGESRHENITELAINISCKKEYIQTPDTQGLKLSISTNYKNIEGITHFESSFHVENYDILEDVSCFYKPLAGQNFAAEVNDTEHCGVKKIQKADTSVN